MINSFLAVPPTPWATSYKIMVGIYSLMIPGQYVSEIKNNMTYSKFFSAQKATFPVPSRLGMFLLYSPAFVVGLVLGAQQLKEVPIPNYSGALLAIHFAKRLFEVLFVHKYSGSMGFVDMVIPGSIGYAITSAVLAHHAKPLELATPSSSIGIAAFIVGSLGNLYHHYLLRKLRKDGDNSSKRYVAPRGGLFEYVACPHYLFEIIAWLGMSCYARDLVGYLGAISMAAYLAGRAKMTTEYYLEKLPEEYPKSRKHLIPFIY